jgi:phosphoribosylamine--glycine ligase
MNILLVGSGGREHALAWKIAQSPLVTRLICAPGNAGIGEVAELAPVNADDMPGIVHLAKEIAADLVVIGPEQPLAEGLADRLAEAGIAAFGPSRAAAQLEASKAFTKEFCVRHAIPTARHATVRDMTAARAFLDTLAPPFVLKADGLAAGKGVVIAPDRETAEAEAEALLSGRFGAASRTLVIEEFLTGVEASVFALCDGRSAVLMAAAQDHKRVGEGDTGPNTGGMGAFSPTPAADDGLLARVMAEIVNPTIRGMAAEGAPFKGVLFAGLMIGADGPKLIEFNCRFGDPETQVLMMRLKSDIVPALMACAEGTLESLQPLQWDSRPAVVVVMAAEGYPGEIRRGTVIKGLEEASRMEGVQIFHAGTAHDSAGELIAAGGRVLGVTASGETLRHAVERAYAAIDRIDWKGGFCRRDIAWGVLGQ